jgi:hypothetical protein
MNKAATIFYCLVLSILIAGLYGIVHDQFSYSISNEYFTKFKFIQFGMGDARYMQFPRVFVAQVGWMSTWWVGLFFTIVVLIFTKKSIHLPNYKKQFLKTIFSILIIAFGIGCIGLMIGYFFLYKSKGIFIVPKDIINIQNFIAVGNLHNFGYLGGVVGLIMNVVRMRRFFG